MTWRRSPAALPAVLLVLVALSASRFAVAAATSPELPARLSDTGLFLPGTITIDPRHRAFSPQYPLWTDGAAKSRWIHLPAGATIDASDAVNWQMPVGTKFWKEFSFNGRRAETRLLWRATESEWRVASYVWNDEGTDATLAPEEGIPSAVEFAPGKRHSIPSANDCRACHGTKPTGPLGFNPLQLSTDRDPNAIHGEPLSPSMITLRTLDNEGLLSPPRPELVAKPPRIAAAAAETRAMLGYMSSNCGTCHNGKGEIAANGPSLHYSNLLEDADEVSRQLIGERTIWQRSGAPEGSTVLIDLNAPEKSAILTRMRSRRPSSQMPPLGTVVRDDEAVAAVAAWIALERSHPR